MEVSLTGIDVGIPGKKLSGCDTIGAFNSGTAIVRYHQVVLVAGGDDVGHLGGGRWSEALDADADVVP
jgi:hypothetical protein